MSFETTPVRICELAGTVTGLAGRLRDELAAARERTTLSAGVFGNSSGAADLATVHDDAAAGAAEAAEAVAGVLEGDVDRLYRTAFDFQYRDAENAGQLDASASGTPAGT